MVQTTRLGAQQMSYVSEITLVLSKSKPSETEIVNSRLTDAAAGGSDDWAKGSAGIKYAYTVELRDTGKHGFILPAAMIKETATETWTALQVVANHFASG